LLKASKRKIRSPDGRERRRNAVNGKSIQTGRREDLIVAASMPEWCLFIAQGKRQNNKTYKIECEGVTVSRK